MKKLVITGSEGLIGRKLKEYFASKYEVIPLDLMLGHDFRDEAFVEKWFLENKGLYGMIVLHAYNPVPVKGSKKVEPVDLPLQELRDYLEVNTVSVFNVCRHFIKNNPTGVIVNASSIYGEKSPKHFIYKDFVKSIAYGITKAAVVNMSKYLACYYGPKFRVNTAVLGGIADPKQDPEFVKKYSENTPQGRLMNLDEVPAVFDFLLDEKSSYVNGAEIFADGGWTAW